MAWILLRPSNYKQVAPLVRTGGSRHTGLAALPHRNIHMKVLQYIMGHAHIDVTMDVYNHLGDRQRIENEVARLNKMA